MNETRRIHLGRQLYNISEAAHKALKNYLAEIESRVEDREVVNEVELRMSELLLEHGITGDKVILPDDISFLKSQLGDPEDFSDNDKETNKAANDSKPARRLFRDTDNAVIAGVATGLANYFGLDALIVRIVFILLTIFGSGLGIALYIVLWLVIPAAETASEKLQMRGRPVTLDGIKDAVKKADVQGATKRVNSKLMPVSKHPRGRDHGAFRCRYADHHKVSWRSLSLRPWLLMYFSTTAQLPPVPTVAA